MKIVIYESIKVCNHLTIFRPTKHLFLSAKVSLPWYSEIRGSECPSPLLSLNVSPCKLKLGVMITDCGCEDVCPRRRGTLPVSFCLQLLIVILSEKHVTSLKFVKQNGNPNHNTILSFL